MTKKKETPTPTPRYQNPRALPDLAQLAYRARVDDTIASLATVEGGPHWVRHTRFEAPTYSAIYHGHRLNVWQADVDDWRVTLDVHAIELAIGRTRTAVQGRTDAKAWADTHDANKIRLVRTLHMGFRTWKLDDTPFLPAVAAELADVLTLA